MAGRPLRPSRPRPPNSTAEDHRMPHYDPRRTVSQASPNVNSHRSANASGRSVSIGTAVSNGTAVASSSHGQAIASPSNVSINELLAGIHARLYLRPQTREAFELLIWWHLLRWKELDSPVLDNLLLKVGPNMDHFPSILIPCLASFMDSYGMLLWPVGDDKRRHLTGTSRVSKIGHWHPDERNSDGGPCYYNDSIMPDSDVMMKEKWKKHCEINGRVGDEMTIEDRQAYSLLGRALQTVWILLLYRGKKDEMFHRATQADPEDLVAVIMEIG